MKLLVVSDVHGDLDALERAVDAEADADAVIFLGDGLREAEDLQDMRPELKIYSVRATAIMPPLPRRTGGLLSAVCYFIIHMVIYIM